MIVASFAIACLAAAQDPKPPDGPRPIEIACEVGPSTTIVKLIADGKEVARGDVLAELDPAPIRGRLEAIKAGLAEAQAQFDDASKADQAARERLKTLTEQTIPGRTKELDRAIQEAEARLQKAKARQEEAQKRFKPGTNPAPVNDAKMAVVKEEQALAEAKTALKVYRDLTAPKDKLQAETDAKAAEATRANVEAAYKIHQGQEEKARAMLDRCKLTAPVSGKVVLNNPKRAPNDKRPPLIREGATVREGQVILRIHPRGD
ncbi:MAG: hypothetical protein U0800_20075 [Isosphaeraceae bacterium]